MATENPLKGLVDYSDDDEDMTISSVDKVEAGKSNQSTESTNHLNHNHSNHSADVDMETEQTNQNTESTNHGVYNQSNHPADVIETEKTNQSINHSNQSNHFVDGASALEAKNIDNGKSINLEDHDHSNHSAKGNMETENSNQNANPVNHCDHNHSNHSGDVDIKNDKSSYNLESIMTCHHATNDIKNSENSAKKSNITEESNGTGGHGQNFDMIQVEVVSIKQCADENMGDQEASSDDDSDDLDDDSDSGSLDSSSSSSSDLSSTTSSSSTSSSSESSVELGDVNKLIEELDDFGIPKTKDEILLEDLPEEAELKVDLPDDAKLSVAGEIQSLVEQIIVIKGMKGCPALDAETILFKENRKPFGKVFDVFGPVPSPFYAVRVKKEDTLESLEFTIGTEIYYAPNYLNLTNYVFLEQLKRMKGSDASWANDQEPPPHCIDFSDDEEEAKAKAAAKKNRQAQRKQLGENSDADDENENKEKQNPSSERSKVESPRSRMPFQHPRIQLNQPRPDPVPRETFQPPNTRFEPVYRPDQMNMPSGPPNRFQNRPPIGPRNGPPNGPPNGIQNGPPNGLHNGPPNGPPVCNDGFPFSPRWSKTRFPNGGYDGNQTMPRPDGLSQHPPTGYRFPPERFLPPTGFDQRLPPPFPSNQAPPNHFPHNHPPPGHPSSHAQPNYNQGNHLSTDHVPPNYPPPNHPPNDFPPHHGPPNHQSANYAPRSHPPPNQPPPNYPPSNMRPTF